MLRPHAGDSCSEQERPTRIGHHGRALFDASDPTTITGMLHIRTSEAADYPPIGDYALIGDCRGAGLVSSDGSLDWLCFPRFDSPSVFAALLDADAGGRFRIRPTGEFRIERRYLPDTNVLETTFHGPSGSLALCDLVTVSSEEDKRTS